MGRGYNQIYRVLISICLSFLLFLTFLYVLRLEQGENIEENRKNLMNLTQKVFNAIVSSSDKYVNRMVLLCGFV